MNAYEELMDSLTHFGKNFSDIDFCKISLKGKYHKLKPVITEKTNIKTYQEKLNFYYDAECGSQNLYGFVVFKDKTWLGRAIYYGAEWWEYNKCPTRTTKIEA